MLQFRIIQVDPFKYREEIICLWKNNLPETPPGRLEWMAENPEGRGIWFLAIHEKTEKVAGSISILPRRVRIEGTTCLAGILGDIMVDREYRGFGCALQLVKSATRDCSKLGFDLLYIFPNKLSEKLTLKAGFEYAGMVSNFIKPLTLRNSLGKLVHTTLTNVISPLPDFILRASSKETYMRTKISYSEITELGPGYELFQREIENKWPTMGERHSDYLEWRYFKNPFGNFRMFTFNSSDNTMLGYLIFTVVNNNAHIFDVLSKNMEMVSRILGEFIKYSRQNGFQSVCIRIFDDNPLRTCFKNFGFFRRKGEDFPLLFFCPSIAFPQNMVFFSGDRNI